MKKEYVIFHEGIFGSIVRDVFTFGCIGFVLYANAKWFGNHGLVAFGLMIMAVIVIMGLKLNAKKTFYNKEDAIKYLTGGLVEPSEIEEKDIQKLESKLFCEILTQFHHIFVTDEGITIDTYRQFYKLVCEKRQEYLDALEKIGGKNVE